MSLLRTMVIAIGMLAGIPEVPAQNAADDSESINTVLLLYSHQTNAPINLDWDRGIRRALSAKLPGGVRIETEHLDLGREEDVEYQNQMVDLLRHKYADIEIDVVIPVFSQAFLFAIDNRDLFPNAPIVFCSVPAALAGQMKGLKNVTGVVFEWELVETVELSRKLFPGIDRLRVVSGGRQWETQLRQSAEMKLSKYDGELEVEYLTGVPLAELENEIAKVDSRSIFLVLSHDGDVNGNTNTTVEATKRICRHPGAPVFGLYDTLLGHGIVGGKLASAETQGELSGDIAARVLNGETADDIAVVGLDSNQYMFDARQLRRWNITEDQLPAGSQVRFQEETFWGQYGRYLVALLLTIAVQALVITALLFHRSRRLMAEQSLRSSRTQARDLAGKLISAQEDERKRLARELHDDLSQRLAASAIAAGKLEHQTESTAKSRRSLTQLKQDLIGISEDVHRISRQIHPAILDDLGLADALRSECDRMACCSGKPVTFRRGELPGQLPNDLALCMYRIAQEALWNAVRHSQSERIQLTLSADKETVFLEVSDQGIGFDSSAKKGRCGLGLASMKERTRIVGGKLEIDSAANRGTVVTAALPLQGPNA